jgi:lipopolysaccharide/colanic/teichoic acid biosynthesis glycosyltransferase
VKRALDLVVASCSLLALGLPLLAIAVAIRLNSRGPALFRQIRVGRFGRPFRIVKFRTMTDGPAHNTGITVSVDDRVTSIGRLLRAAKIDELPQLLNVLSGDMSIVGPRPELPNYVETYSEHDKRVVLSVRPGMTDFASIVYIRETELLAAQPEPLAYYQRVVLPRKLAYCRFYVRRVSLSLDLYLIGRTVVALATEAMGRSTGGRRARVSFRRGPRG